MAEGKENAASPRFAPSFAKAWAPADVFISYKREERGKAFALAQALLDLKLDVWIDARLEPGLPFDAEIEREVEHARAVVVCWSSLARLSDWVKNEARTGADRGVLAPVFLERCRLPLPFQHVHTADLSDWFGERDGLCTAGAPDHGGWLALLERIGALTDRPGLVGYARAQAAATTDALVQWAVDHRDDPLAATVWADIEAEETAALRTWLDRLRNPGEVVPVAAALPWKGKGRRLPTAGQGGGTGGDAGLRGMAISPLTGFEDAPFAPAMVVIPAGSFVMGSSRGEEGREEDEGPAHRVTIARPFAIGRQPVTFAQFDRFCEASGRERCDDMGWGRGRRPVINVRWLDALAYCLWLSHETGHAYRLPSEAEWEYACRAGTTTAFSCGDSLSDRDGNHGYLLGRTAEVGSYCPNAWGLFDMHGNVWEWVEDVWHDSYLGAPADGSAWLRDGDPECCVLRGGAWDVPPAGCRSACRFGGDVMVGGCDRGFRVARRCD